MTPNALFGWISVPYEALPCRIMQPDMSYGEGPCTRHHPTCSSCTTPFLPLALLCLAQGSELFIALFSVECTYQVAEREKMYSILCELTHPGTGQAVVTRLLGPLLSRLDESKSISQSITYSVLGTGNPSRMLCWPRRQAGSFLDVYWYK